MSNVIPILTAQFRKSIEILKNEQVPYIEWLPPYTSSGLRQKEDVCDRAICLMVVAARAEGLELDIVQSIMEKYDVKNKFTFEELEFLKKETFDFQNKVKFLWRYESLWILLWSLGYINQLKRPENICDVGVAVGIIYDRTTAQLISESMPKNLDEVLDLADLTLRYHWAARNENLKGNPSPSNLDQSVLYERHYAFEWLLNKNIYWDNVDTST